MFASPQRLAREVTKAVLRRVREQWIFRDFIGVVLRNASGPEQVNRQFPARRSHEKHLEDCPHVQWWLQVWNLESGELLHTLKGHREGVLSVSVTPDCRLAVSGNLRDGTLRMWDLNSGQCGAVYRPSSLMYAVTLVPGGNTICIGTRTGTVFFLEIRGIQPGPDLKPDVAPDMSNVGYEQFLRRGLEFIRREK